MNILVSRCLLGEACRYDGRAKPDIVPQLAALGFEIENIIAICPESDGGLPTPRPPCEIEPGCTGADVCAGRARVVSSQGEDRTNAYLAGAAHALSLAHQHNAPAAILKERSPSCGTHQIYDGRFSGVPKTGDGVAAALLQRHGIVCFSETELDRFAKWLRVRRNSDASNG